MKKTLSKTNASIYNMLMTGTYQLVTALFGFILPNLILNGYGANLHGYTSTVSNVMGYIALINAGLGSAAVQALYAPLAKKDSVRTGEVLKAIDRFYTLSGCLYTLAVGIVAAIMPWMIGDQLPDSMVVALMIVIGAGSTLECFVYSKYRVFLQADQKLFVVSLVDLVCYVIRCCSQIALILNQFSVILVMLVPAIMVAVRAAMLHLYYRKNYPQIDRKVKPDYSALSHRKATVIHQLGGLVVYNTDVTLLTIAGNLAEVSVYSVYNLVFHHLYQLLTNVFSHGTMASFGRLMNENKRDRLLRAYDLYEFGYYFIISFVYSVTAAMILPFVSVYTREVTGVLYFRPDTAVLFVLIGIVNNMRVPCITMINAAGHFKQTQNHALLEVLINLVMSVCLLPFMGMNGLLVGTICSFLYRTTITIVYSHRHILHISTWKAVLRIARVIVVILLSSGIYAVFIGRWQMNGWLEWIAYACLMSVISASLTVMMAWITEHDAMKACAGILLKRKKRRLIQSEE